MAERRLRGERTPCKILGDTRVGLRGYRKERLHQLIEELPDTELETVERFLRAAREAAYGADPLVLALDAAPEDDEPLSEEDAQALREAREDFAASRTVSLADLKRDLGR